jgi:hypothetical protein
MKGIALFVKSYCHIGLQRCGRRGLPGNRRNCQRSTLRQLRRTVAARSSGTLGGSR